MPERAESGNVYFVSLGCPKNRVDTEVMLGEVGRAGYSLVHEPELADIIVVNTCGFIEAAKEESIDTILEMAQYKAEGRCDKLVVTGCLTQRYPTELAQEIPEIDQILGSADFHHIVQAVSKTPTSLPVIQVSEVPTRMYDHHSPRVHTGGVHSAYVKIAEGCDRPCAFCIIPKLRGPQRSRTIESVVAEVSALAALGTKEINLIAQDLTRYGTDLAGPKAGPKAGPEAGQEAGQEANLAALLRALGRIEGIRWIRLHYTYPSAFTDELIDVIASEPKVAKYIDVPLQHIDDSLLKRMRRGHSSRVIRELVQRLRTRIDNVVLRTTFIVGHPGESEDAFERLRDFVEETRFEHVGVFTYSQEQDTVSALMPHRVPAEAALERRNDVMALQAEISREHNRAMIGKEIEVMVEGLSDDSELLLQGRWYGQAPEIDGCVYLTNGTADVGELVRATVVDAAEYDLAASIVDHDAHDGHDGTVEAA